MPRNIATRLTSVYGMVEVTNFDGPLTVDATYGGVDAAIVEGSIGELNAETNYGQIYSNLGLDFNAGNVTTEDFHTSVTVKPGQGPKYSFESKYGNVYLRRAEKGVWPQQRRALTHLSNNCYIYLTNEDVRAA